MITKVTLQRFKCFEKPETVLLSKINLFAGCNGRGKSSFLQALLLIAQSIDTEKRLNHIQINGKFIELGTFEDIKNIKTKAKPTITFCTDDKAENIITLKIAPHDKKPQWGQLFELNINDKKLVEKIGSATGNENVKNAPTALGATSTVAGLAQLHNVYYISADRKGPTDFYKKNDNREDNHIGVHGEELINLLAHKGDGFVKELAKHTSMILSGATIAVKDIGTDYIKLILDSSNDTQGFRPSNVGFGYSYILPIIATLLFAENSSKVFIENPEAHLHPGAQSRLMNFMIEQSKIKNIQLFIETHSDHVINCLRIAIAHKKLQRNDAGIIYFSKSEDNKITTTRINIDSQGNLSDYPEGFMDEWGLQMSQLV